jgi:hypothetical protein
MPRVPFPRAIGRPGPGRFRSPSPLPQRATGLRLRIGQVRIAAAQYRGQAVSARPGSPAARLAVRGPGRLSPMAPR